MGTPRSSFLQRSASVPPTSVMGAEKAIPSMARHTSKVSILRATAQGMMKMTATNKVAPLACVSRLNLGDGRTQIMGHLLDHLPSVDFTQWCKHHGPQAETHNEDGNGDQGDFLRDTKFLDDAPNVRGDDG